MGIFQGMNMDKPVLSEVERKEGLISALLKKSLKADGRKKLKCIEAFEIAREFKAEPVEIGRICNQNNIRICKCQLGCFA
jgi:biotin synthase-related radical SAM superfamily protein